MNGNKTWKTPPCLYYWNSPIFLLSIKEKRITYPISSLYCLKAFFCTWNRNIRKAASDTRDMIMQGRR